MFKKQELVPLEYGGSRIKLAVGIALFAVSAIGYTAILGVLGAMALLAFILIHEGGHSWAAERVGGQVKGIYFLPFLGAAVDIDTNSYSHKADFYTAIMGPAMDLTFALIALVGYWYTRSVVFPAIAAIFAFIDLLNLLPVLPLDGGLMFKSITFSFSPKIKLSLIALGFLISSLVCSLTVILPNILTLFIIVTNAINQGGMKAAKFFVPFFLVAYLLFCSFQMAWALLQSKILAQEEKMAKKKMSKAEVVSHSLLYLTLIGTLLLIIAFSFKLIAANPEGLLDFMSLRIP